MGYKSGTSLNGGNPALHRQAIRYILHIMEDELQRYTETEEYSLALLFNKEVEYYKEINDENFTLAGLNGIYYKNGARELVGDLKRLRQEYNSGARITILRNGVFNLCLDCCSSFFESVRDGNSCYFITSNNNKVTETLLYNKFRGAVDEALNGVYLVVTSNISRDCLRGLESQVKEIHYSAGDESKANYNPWDLSDFPNLVTFRGRYNWIKYFDSRDVAAFETHVKELYNRKLGGYAQCFEIVCPVTYGTLGKQGLITCFYLLHFGKVKLVPKIITTDKYEIELNDYTESNLLCCYKLLSGGTLESIGGLACVENGLVENYCAAAEVMKVRSIASEAEVEYAQWLDWVKGSATN